MRALLLADTHFDSNIEHLYRFEVFSHMESWIVSNNIDFVILLGDLTEEKDRHNSVLVNRTVEMIKTLSDLCRRHGSHLIVLKGNHDYVEESVPYFKFLGSFHNVFYIVKPFCINDEFWCLPHTTAPELDWADVNFNNKIIFAHQPVIGAVMGNGVALKEGVSKEIFRDSIVYSGHIHIPQDLGNIHYVGAPYQVYFREDFNGRMILLDTEKPEETRDIWLNFQKKITFTMNSLEDLHKLKTVPKDFIRFKVNLKELDYNKHNEFTEEIKKEVATRQLILKGIEFILPTKVESKNKKSHLLSDEEYIIQYAKRERLSPDSTLYGLDIAKMKKRESLDEYSINSD